MQYNVLCSGKCPDGKCFTQTLLTNWIDSEKSSAMSDQKIKFVGTRGRYESDQKERGVRVCIDGMGMEHINPDFCTPYGCDEGGVMWQGYGIDSVCSFLDDVENLLSGKVNASELEKTRPTFRQALISTAVVEAANSSLIEDSSWQTVENIGG